MSNPPIRSFGSSLASRQSWIDRVRGNLSQLLEPIRLPTPANGAPIHLLKSERTGRVGRAQSLSLAAHAGVIAAFLLFAVHPYSKNSGAPPKGAKDGLHRWSLPMPILDERLFGRPQDGRGSGGVNNPIPTTRGELPPRSSIQLVPPWQPENSHPRRPQNPTLLDPEAPRLTSVPYTELGLPWMKEYTNSAGPGGPHGYGSQHGNSMGDNVKGPAGRGTVGVYNKGVTNVQCMYCPDPQYSD